MIWLGSRWRPRCSQRGRAGARAFSRRARRRLPAADAPGGAPPAGQPAGGAADRRARGAGLAALTLLLARLPGARDRLRGHGRRLRARRDRRLAVTARSLLGPNPGLGVRFFGIGNELESILAVLIRSALGAALAAARGWAARPRRGRRSPPSSPPGGARRRLRRGPLRGGRRRRDRLPGGGGDRARWRCRGAGAAPPRAARGRRARGRAGAPGPARPRARRRRAPQPLGARGGRARRARRCC